MTKSANFSPARTNFSEEDYAKLFLQESVKLHGAPVSFMSDCGTQFSSLFLHLFHRG